MNQLIKLHLHFLILSKFFEKKYIGRQTYRYPLCSFFEIWTIKKLQPLQGCVASDNSLQAKDQFVTQTATQLHLLLYAVVVNSPIRCSGFKLIFIGVIKQQSLSIPPLLPAGFICKHRVWFVATQDFVSDWISFNIYNKKGYCCYQRWRIYHLEFDNRETLKNKWQK